jgi:hypothetical protein
MFLSNFLQQRAGYHLVVIITEYTPKTSRQKAFRRTKRDTCYKRYHHIKDPIEDPLGCVDGYGTKVNRLDNQTLFSVKNLGSETHCLAKLPTSILA